MRSLGVYLYAERIGTLYENDERRYLFTFDADFAERGSSAPVLSLGFLSPAKHPRSQRTTGTEPAPFFLNLLPERGGVLREYLAAQGNIDTNDDMGLLSLLGHDLSGAATIRPDDDWTIRPYEGELSPSQRPFRFSLAGLQMKFSAKRNTDGSFRITESGEGGTHILKLPEPGKIDLTANEHAMMLFARSIGIAVPEVGLVSLDAIEGLPDRFRDSEQPAFFAQRFDRNEAERIHIEDFAQITRVPPSRKYSRVTYDQLLSLIHMLMGAEATKDFIRRLVFTIAIANADMHLKNWSVIYRNRITPALAPAYDFVCIAAYPRYDDKLALPLQGVVHWEKIRKETFLQAAQHAKPAVPAHLVHEALEESITAILDSWKSFQNDDCLPIPVKTIIERQLSTIPLFQ